MRRNGGGTGGRGGHDDRTRASRPVHLIPGYVLHLSSGHSRHQAGPWAQLIVSAWAAIACVLNSMRGAEPHRLTWRWDRSQASVRPLRAVRLNLVGFTRWFYSVVPGPPHLCSRGLVRSLRGMPIACSIRRRGDNYEGDLYLRESVSASVRRSRLRRMRASMLFGMCGCHRIGRLLCPLCRRSLAVLHRRRGPLLGVRAEYDSALGVQCCGRPCGWMLGVLSAACPER